jgi:hypothetical protein
VNIVVHPVYKGCETIYIATGEMCSDISLGLLRMALGRVSTAYTSLALAGEVDPFFRPEPSYMYCTYCTMAPAKRKGVRSASALRSPCLLPG